MAPRRDFHSEGLGKIVEKNLAKGAKVFIEGALRTRKWQDQSGADRYSTEVHPTQYNATLTVLDARKDDARSSEQQATRVSLSIRAAETATSNFLDIAGLRLAGSGASEGQYPTRFAKMAFGANADSTLGGPAARDTS